MKPIAYTIAYLPGVLALIAVSMGGWWLAAVPLFIFGIVPVVELVWSGSPENVSEADGRVRKKQRIFDVLLFGIVPLQVAAVAGLVIQVSRGAFTGWEVLGAVMTVGICCGMYGLNVGHELGHRSGHWGKRMALVMMGSSLYPHFLLEHNRGHHRWVATPQDPASARKGQWVYLFWLQSVVGGFRSAWSMDRGHVIRVWGVTLACWLGVLLALGPLAALAWVGAGLVGIGLLETVNYLEHYGLMRAKQADGHYERTQPCHSWNSNNPLGRALLFDLTRHSDHHAYPNRRYQVLRSHEDAPLLPTGYPGLILVSLIPPLFFAIMHPHIRREKARLKAA